MKVLVCFGTRPEAIKMAPVIIELERQKIEYKVCVTAQHREMLDQILEFFQIKPDYDLNIMKINQSLNELGSAILEGVDQILERENPDLILVHGDTTTSVFAAFAAFHRNVEIGHVEAGLRTHNFQAPFPEEMNRQITGRLSNYHFAPTIKAKCNLLTENIPEENVIVTGNTVVDAIIVSKSKLRTLNTLTISSNLGLPKKALKKFVLVTGHRRESFGEGLRSICVSLLELSKTITIIYPVHLNPNVKNAVNKELSQKENIFLLDPVNYLEMLWLIKNSEFVISDSGGIQEEAPSFGKKVLVTRENSERLEGVDSEFAVLVGANKYKILKEAEKLLKEKFKPAGKNPYGDGYAAKNIVAFIKNKFEK